MTATIKVRIDTELQAELVPSTSSAHLPQVVSHTIALFPVTLLMRRVPFDRPRLRPARSAALALVLLSPALLPAQGQATMPADEVAVRAAIDAALRDRGDLSQLAASWKNAPALHRYWLARAQGDLATAAQLCTDPTLTATHRDVRVQMLDVLGRPTEALAALGSPDENLPAAERGAWLVRRAWLQFAKGDRDAAAADLRAAVAAAAQPAFSQQTAVLAAAFGFFDLALQWHVVGTEPGRDACQAALRRGLWQQRAQHLAEAGHEYELAFRRGSMQRDRVFALAMLVAVHRAAGTLPALADAWLLRAGGTGKALHPAELAALGEVLRELGRARDGLHLLARLTPELQRELGELALTFAIEAGEPEVAITQLQQQLASQPDDAAARCSLAMLLADLQRNEPAEQVLRAGITGARARDLRRLCATASELGMDDVVQAIANALGAISGVAAGGEEKDPIEGALLEVAHLRRQGKDVAAIARLLRARDAARRPTDRLRLAEQLESLGRKNEAIELYTAIWEEAATEDTGMRLAWLLGESKVEADRQRAQAIFRKVWTSAGSAARRVQAEEHVLDLAAREGTLADLALELETQLADPATPNRPAVRDALVKIYTRARDTTGAAAILQQWAKEEPLRQVEALQQLARVHLSAEEFRNHERALQRLLELDPEGELDYRQQLAMSALERGRPDDARRHIRDLLGKPGTPDTIALEFSAGIYALAAQHEEAVRLYRRALALHPERVEVYLLLGNALRAAGQRDAAIGTFQELMLAPLPDDLFVVAVDGLLNMEAPAPVLAAAARAVRSRLAARPEQVFLHRVLQDLLEAQQDEPGRVRALEDTIVAAGEQRPNFVRELMQEAELKRDWRAYAGHGRTLLVLGDEVPPAVYLSLGEALLHIGDLDAAARSFARARLGADFVAIEARTAELYENAGRLAEAERLRVRLLRRTPEEPGAILAVARLAERQGALLRALPNWLAAALRLLPAELDVVKPAAGGRRPILPVSREKPTVTFGEAFAGVLRCATSTAELAALREAIDAAAATGTAERRLAALRLLRHLARAYGDGSAVADLRASEDALLDSGDARVRSEIRSQRLAAGDVAGAAAIAAGAEVTVEELRLALLGGDPQALAAAAALAQPELLPDLAGMLLVAGRAEEAAALLPLLEGYGDDDAMLQARDRMRALLGLPVQKDLQRAQQRLEQALARTGPLLAKVNALFQALRDLPEFPAAERQGHVRTLAEAVVAAKDANAAERLLANGRADLDADGAVKLVELVFGGERVPLSLRGPYLDAVPVERAVELVRAVLRKLPEEQRRTQLLALLGNQRAPEPVLLALVGDCDPRGVQGTDRMLFTNGLERARNSPAVSKALADRFAATVPDDLLTVLLQIRTAGDAEAQRRAAVHALPAVAVRKFGDRDELVANQLVGFVTRDDAKALLLQLPERAAPAVRIALLQKAGEKEAAVEALVAAHRQKPDDTALLYRAANYCESEGFFAHAAELYRTAQKTGPTFYPYQAQQLARLELQAGNPDGALAALRAAKDPLQSNFRLALRVLAEVRDETVRRAALADVLQQRAARGASGGVVFAMARALGAGGVLGAGDRLAAVLAPVRLPPLAPRTLAEADDAPSDYDLLAFLPEGEEVGRTLLRTLDDAARGADLGIYRGMLGASKRAGRGQQLVDDAAAVLRTAPFDAEALRVVFAGAQVGLVVPPELLRVVLQHAASEPRLKATTIGALISLAADGGEPELAERVLRLLLQQRAAFADAELRPWLPGLFAMACQKMPALVLELGKDGNLDSDAAAELGCALVLHHAAAAAAARVVSEVRGNTSEANVSRNGSDLLPQCGALLMLGDVEGAAKVLQQPGVFWMQARLLGPHRLAAAVPPLGRWSSPGLAAAFGDKVVALASEGEDERREAMARVGAVLAARVAADGNALLAAALRAKLRAATAGLSWRADDWLPQ